MIGVGREDEQKQAGTNLRGGFGWSGGVAVRAGAEGIERHYISPIPPVRERGGPRRRAAEAKLCPTRVRLELWRLVRDDISVS